MDNNSHSSHRLTNTSHFLTVLALTAVLAVFLIPLSAHPTGRRTAVPIETLRSVAHSRTRSSVSQHPATTTTVPTTASPTTAPVPVTTPTTAPAPAPPRAAPQAPAIEAVATVPSGDGCAPALTYLQEHAAPGFTFECPGWADGHQAMSCDNVADICPGAKVIVISTPCPAAYMNEASNSWVILGESKAALDPYGYCH